MGLKHPHLLKTKQTGIDQNIFIERFEQKLIKKWRLKPKLEPKTPHHRKSNATISRKGGYCTPISSIISSKKH